MKLSAKLTFFNIISFIIGLSLLIIATIFIINNNQENNLEIFKRELIEEVSEINEGSAELFFTLINNKFLEGANRKEVIEYVKSIDETNRNVIIYDLQGNILTKDHSRKIFDNMINNKIIQKELKKYEETKRNWFERANLSEYLSDKEIKTPAILQCKIYKHPNLIIGYGKVFDTMKNRVDFMVRMNEESFQTFLWTFVIVLGVGMLITLINTILFVRRYVSRPLNIAVKAANSVASGDLSVNIKVKTTDEIGNLMKSLQAVVESSREISSIAQEIANGNLDVEVKLRSDNDELAIAYNKSIMSLKEVIAEISHLKDKHIAGDYEARIDADRFVGSYHSITNGINDVVNYHVGAILKIITLLGEYADGDFSKTLDKYHGKSAVINEVFDKIRNNLLGIVDEIKMIINEAIEGNLEYRGNADKFKGAFSDIVNGINSTLNTVLEPIINATDILKRMSEGDLTEHLSGDYKGDHALLKDAVNSTLDGINDILYHVSIAIEQVSNGSKQVSQASQTLSQGATEQASSLEQITSSLTEINSQTKQNLDKVINTNKIAEDTVTLGNEGNKQLIKLIESMEAINVSSDNIKKITKMIDDISFQINLLALNASVEAARAGKYGKGFAVVAEEVRNLAVRSAESVKESSAMVDEAIKNIDIINSLVDKTKSQFEQITHGSEQSSAYLDEIVSAVKEQSFAIDEIDRGLEQVGQVTQSNTANAEESASAAEELSSQSTQLQNMISKFKIRKLSTDKIELDKDEQTGLNVYDLDMQNRL